MTELRDPKSTPPADEADPLHNLYRMSRTAGLGSGDYVAINNTAIIALILGLASVLALLSQGFILVAVAAVICGIMAMIQIGSSGGTQTGRVFAIGGILLGLGFGGVAVGRIVTDKLQQREDERAIAKLVNRLGELIAARQYSQAYQTLFSESFKKDFDEPAFQRQWEAMTAFAGPVKSIGWGERAEFERAKATETTRAAATSEVVFEKMPARQPILFSKVKGGEWEIDSISQMFEKPKERPDQAPSMPDYSVPQGPQLPAPQPQPAARPGVSVARPSNRLHIIPAMPSESPARVEFFGLTAAEFDGVVVEWGWPRFRAQQVRDWVYGKLAADPARMTNLAKRDHDMLRERATFATSAITTHQSSNDGTQKLLLTWPDEAGGAVAECVMIPDGDRRTACISSQVGCPVGCRFCASGINGVKGNLSAAQIVEQVFRLNEMLVATDGPDARRITNIVFMGMGEPLSNYANVMKAVEVLHDPTCFNLGARRITISTVGVPAKMRQLAGEGLPINLAISLHAPNEPLRKQLIPWAEHFGLNDILDAARFYFDKTGREVTLEYILLSGVNDRPEHARELAKLCKTLRANVNLIRYNEVAGLPYVRPTAHDVVRFQEILRTSGVNAHVRKSRGRDIDAACGQLRRKQAEKAGAPALVSIDSVPSG